MRVGILGLSNVRGETLREVSRLREEIIEAGHEPAFINYRRTALVVNTEGRVLHQYSENGKALEPIDVDVVVPRIGRYYKEGCFAVQALALQGIPATASAVGIRNSKNKDWSALLLDSAGVPVPFQSIPNGRLPDDTDILLKPVEPPSRPKRMVIKTAYGSHGDGVMLAESRKSARSILQGSIRRRPIAQEFIEPPEDEEGYSDIRLIVLGTRVQAGMKRTTSSREEEREFRTNLSLGAEGEPYEPTQREEEIAVKAVSALGLEFGGVDIMHSQRGPLVLEVNSNPEFGIEQVTGANVARILTAHAIGKVALLE